MSDIYIEGQTFEESISLKEDLKKVNMRAVILLIAFSGCGKNEAEVYLFSFFQGNGEDGLQ